MTRTAYRNLMLGLLVLFTGVAVFLFVKCQSIEEQIIENQNNLTRLSQERENARRLNLALSDLDQLTINEKTATQLDILRHLGLEQSDVDFRLESRELRAVGATSLYVHNVRLVASLPYPAALYLCDRLQNTKKIILNTIELSAANNGGVASSNIQMQLTGRIYGLDKIEQPVTPGAPQ